MKSNTPAEVSSREHLLPRLAAGVWRRRWIVAITTLSVVGGAALAERNAPRVTSSNPSPALLRTLLPTTRSAADMTKLEQKVAAARERQQTAHAAVERAKAAIDTDPERAAKVKNLILTRGYEPLPTTDLEKLLAEITRTESEISADRGELPAGNLKIKRASEWLDTLLAGYCVVAEREEADATNRVTTALGDLARAGDPQAQAANTIDMTDALPEDEEGLTHRLIALLPVLARSIAIGLALGITATALMELFDRRFRSPAHVRNATKLRVLGAIPVPARSMSSGTQKAAMIDRAACRTIRGLLSKLVGGPVDQRSGILLVASALPGEGRSTVAVATAAALASVGERVVLVDADANDPIQHHRLNLPEIGGLTAALDDPASVQMFVRTSYMDGFDLLPHGKPSPDVRDKITGPEMKELLTKLRDTYPYVIVDAGSLLLSPEARAVATCCDAAVFVVHADQTRPQHAKAGYSLLKRINLLTVGAIVNALPDDHRRSAFDLSAPQEAPRRAARPLLPSPDDDDEHELHLA